MEVLQKIYHGNPNYIIYSDGRVWSTYRYHGTNGRFLKPSIGTGGYYVVVLYPASNVSKIHRLVAECFIPNPENKPQINHIDCNKLNNNVYNLEWVTHKENARHAYDNGLCYITRGEDNTKSILTEADVLYIRKVYQTKHPEFGSKPLREKFNVSKDTILNVVNRKTWKHIP